MATPAQRSTGGEQHRTPCSGRHTAIVRTPQSALTPNDDAAEKASIRRKRRSEALRKSLSDAFAAGGDQQQGPAKPTLSPEALSAMFEQCIKLAAENKITDKNVWQLDLIQHLPSIVRSGQAVSSSTGFNFQKMSGGLDAGMTIYSKRVDHTYKEVFQSLQGNGSSSKDADGGDDAAGGDGCEDDGDDDVEDAAAAAAKQHKQGAAASKRGKQGAAKEEATLATAEQLKQKKVDNTFAVDPLFHKMSALFDEGGAKGLLLLNRSVFNGASIMTDPHEVPEQQFPLQPSAAPDTLLNLQRLRRQLAACSAHSTAGGAGSSTLLTPDLDQMYALLKQALKHRPGQQQQQQSSIDVAAVMAAATRGLPATPMPAIRSSSTGGASAAAAHAPAADSDAMQCDDGLYAAGSDAAADSAGAAAGCAASVTAGSAAVAAFLADAATAGPEEHAARGDSWGDGAGMYDDDGMAGEEGLGHAGYEDDGDAAAAACGAAGAGENAGWMDAGRRQCSGQGMLGLGDGGVDDAQEVLDAEALQQLLGGAAAGAATGPSSKAATTQGSGWAGSSFWKYKSAAAAIARLQGGGGAAAAKKAATAGGSASKSRSGHLRIDFTNLPELPPGALAQGSRKQTCLVSTSSAATLLPQDLHYQASSLAQLFLKPAPVSYIRQPGINSSAAAAGGAFGSAPAAAADGSGTWGDDDDHDGGWGGEGYGDDDNDSYNTGAEGYNAGDLSVGDPGYSGAAGGFGGAADGDDAGGDWWSSEHELLTAPKRVTGLGVNYNRSAKQVDVRALKDLLWDSLVTVNTTAAAGSPDNSSSSSMDADDAEDAGSAGGSNRSAATDPTGPTGPTIPFQDVIVSVPEQSAAGSLGDVSVHMCFICLLHLANEKGLVIRAKEDLKTLTISNVNSA